MAEYYFTRDLGCNKSLRLAPLTSRRLAASGQELTAVAGYFLYEQEGESDDAPVAILAHAVSEEAELRLRDLFSMD